MAVSKKVNHGKKRHKRSIHQLNEIRENKRARRREKAFKIVLHSLYGISFLVGVALLSIAIWYQNSYNISFKDLLLSTVTPMGTVSEGFLSQMLSSCVIPVAIGAAVYIGASILLWKDTPKRRVMRIVGAVLCDVIFVSALVYATIAFKIPEYLNLIF